MAAAGGDTDEALEAALSLFAHAGTKQAVVVRFE